MIHMILDTNADIQEKKGFKTLWAGSCAIDFTQLGHQKCFGTK